ncbi:NAD(P)H-dependent oxidoreductase [Casaltella massiliensis]|nr:NAD(P)H-dependent oxidoreductase [Casaltella massiliensis]
MKLLFVNACMRGKESRTHQLCMDYLEKFLRAKKEEDWQIEELDLNSMDIQPLTGDSLARRDFLSRDKKFEDDEFALANQMIEADHVLIGAPYWDLSFPAKLKTYLERCSVTGLTFIYSPQGVPEGQCRASSLTYITTSGSAIADFNFGYEYIKGLCCLFGIPRTHFVSAEELDIIGNDIHKIMTSAKDKITDIIDEL